MSETIRKNSTPDDKRMVSEEAYLAVVETCRGLSHALLAARDMVRGLDNVLFIDRALADPQVSAQHAAAKTNQDDGQFAWAALAENGNVIIWSRQRSQVEPVAAKYGRPVVPVIALPASAASAGSDHEEAAYQRGVEDGKLIARGMARLASAAPACSLPPAGWKCTRHLGHDGPCAAHPVQDGEKDAALDPVEGDLLPPVGSKVLIHLARQDAWVEHTVTGYYVWSALSHQVKEGERNAHRVFVRVKDAHGYDNARLLSEVRIEKS